MAATLSDINRWLDGLYNGEDNVTHMIVVCDTYDYDDYPVYIKRGTNPREYRAGSMQRIMEVYSRNHTREAQLNQGRAFNYD